MLHYMDLLLTSSEDVILFSKMFISFYAVTCNVWEFYLLYIFSNNWSCPSFKILIPSNECIVISHCGMNFILNLFIATLYDSNDSSSPSIYLPVCFLRQYKRRKKIKCQNSGWVKISLSVKMRKNMENETS